MNSFTKTLLASASFIALAAPAAMAQTVVLPTGPSLAGLPAGESGASVAPTQQTGVGTVAAPVTPGIAGLPPGEAGASIAPTQQAGTSTITVSTVPSLAGLPASEAGTSAAPKQQGVTVSTTPSLAGLPAGEAGASIAPTQQVPVPATGPVSPLTGSGASGGETGTQNATVNQINDLQGQITTNTNTINSNEAAQAVVNTAQAATNAAQVTTNAAQVTTNTAQAATNVSLQSGIQSNASLINADDATLTNQEVGTISADGTNVTLGNAASGYTGPVTLNNVANGSVSSGSTQAINGGQLYNAEQGFNQQIAGVNQQIAGLNSQIGKVERAANAGTAAAMAVPSLPLLAPGKEWIGASYGEYAGQSALGVGYAYQINSHWNVGAGVSVPVTGGNIAFKVQAGYEF